MYLGRCDECDSEDLALLSVGTDKGRVEKALAELSAEYKGGGVDFLLDVGDIDSVVVCARCGHVNNYVERYKDEYRPENQTTEDGVIFNPKQRFYFDSLDNQLRPHDEYDDWFGLPYVVTEEYAPADASYQNYVDRLSGYGLPIEPENEFNQRIAEGKASWFKAFPTGTRYNVRCFNGGAWDRSSSVAFTGSKSEAIAIAKEIIGG